MVGATWSNFTDFNKNQTNVGDFIAKKHSFVIFNLNQALCKESKCAMLLTPFLGPFHNILINIFILHTYVSYLLC